MALRMLAEVLGAADGNPGSRLPPGGRVTRVFKSTWRLTLGLWVLMIIPYMLCICDA